MKLALTTLFSVALVVGSAATSAGDTINIDLQSPNPASVDAAGNDGPYSQSGTSTWNALESWEGVSDMPLVDAGGVSAGLTLSVTANGGWFSDTYSSASPNSAVFDYFQFQDTGQQPEITFSIDNVAAGDYELYVMAGVSQFTQGVTADVSVTGVTDPQFITWTGSSDLPSGTGWASGVNYVKFDVTLSSPGTIAGTVIGNSDIAILNGLQLVDLTVVPEPTTFSMLGLFGGALFFIRRRSKS